MEPSVDLSDIIKTFLSMYAVVCGMLLILYSQWK